jgi:hypothetical protein
MIMLVRLGASANTTGARRQQQSAGNAVWTGARKISLVACAGGRRPDARRQAMLPQHRSYAQVSHPRRQQLSHISHLTKASH